ncbi:hypothetical protein QEJ31_09035 [Pigmentibacter sp. JX0631]|uniref:hypothetical protein n=1 Tax=Pigmentibacter sp. JX0631 TaxID=2976982 RepID=UPI00246913DB|nr:hypothetical protein [Pigmentibacter sp. JX0631]WGL58674.1 hypothetical protein QEJ31_09035 [Pigmentibacter sp. JX0631]
MDKFRSLKESLGFRTKYSGRYTIQDFMNHLVKNEEGFSPDNSGNKLSFDDFLKVIESGKLRQLNSDYNYLGKYYYYIKLSIHPEKDMFEIGNGEISGKQLLMQFYEKMPSFKYSHLKK